MDTQYAEQIIFLLESINDKLDMLSDIKDSIEVLGTDISIMKMDISGFQHEGKDYPGTLSQIQTSLDSIETNINFRS